MCWHHCHIITLSKTPSGCLSTAKICRNHHHHQHLNLNPHPPSLISPNPVNHHPNQNDYHHLFCNIISFEMFCHWPNHCNPIGCCVGPRNFTGGGDISHFGGNHAPYLPTFTNENYFQMCLIIWYKIPFTFGRHDHQKPHLIVLLRTTSPQLQHTFFLI